ncbi:hypothetical protein ACJIZ3_006608 [Penstemon smallii]|uniref:RING-CH-type domain-containing protein n=1 Tax=Penstemon smallii TaxID=265156 RepID=A0ABD3S889_9LAMI
MDSPPLHPNDNDPASPHLPLVNDDLTKSSPVPSPPPKEVIDIEPKRYLPNQTSLPSPFNNVVSNDDFSYFGAPSHDEFLSASPPDIDDDSPYLAAPPTDFDDDCSIDGATLTSDIISNPPPNQSVSSSALQQKKKKRRNIFSRIEQKSSSNNNLDLKGHVMVKVRTTPADIIKLENNTRIIPEEEAVCRFCFHPLFSGNNDHHNNNNNVMMLKCKCKKLSLTHELCASEWSDKEGNNNKCNVCDQDVTLSKPTDNSSSITPKPDKGFTLKKLWSCYSCQAD